MAISISKSLKADRIQSIPLRAVCGVTPDTPIRRALSMMVEAGTGCALVLDGGRLSGIFTERDFAGRVIAAGMDLDAAVERVMTASPQTVPSDATVQQAIEVMESRGYRHLPVVADGGQVVGVLSVKDIMHYLVTYFPAKVYNLPPNPEPTSHDREGA
jgi:CBS domain-containing protein